MDPNPPDPTIVTQPCPDSDYFRAYDIAPWQGLDGAIHVFAGSARGGTSQVTSTVEPVAPGVVRVVVVGRHRYSTSPVGGTYFFVHDPQSGQYVRRTAAYSAVRKALRG